MPQFVPYLAMSVSESDVSAYFTNDSDKSAAFQQSLNARKCFVFVSLIGTFLHLIFSSS